MKNPTSTPRPTIHWQGVPHPELEESIFQELRELGIYDDGEDLSGLVFHTYIVDPENFDGPSVDVFWEEDKLCAAYTLKTSWVKASDALKRVTPPGEGASEDEDDGA